MPPRSAKMKRRIFGFQRRVWWPKWTPASSSSRIETAPVATAMRKLLPGFRLCRAPAGVEAHLPQREARAPRLGPPGSRYRDAGRLAAARRFERCGEVGRERRAYVDRLARDGMVEGESRCVEELPLEPQIARDAIERITGDGEVDRGEMHADLVRTAGLQADAQECALRQELVELEVRHGGARLG